jgi:hypothetical protein
MTSSTPNVLVRYPGGTLITGSGSANYISKWTSASTLGNSIIYDNGTNVGIGTISPAYKLDVSGDVRVTGTLYANAISGTYTGTINAANVSSGQFGANTGGGNYSFLGNVGIGTTAPETKLDVNGNIRAAGSPVPANWYNFQAGSVGVSTVYGYDSICTGNAWGNCQGSGGVVIGRTNTAATVNIPNSGNVFFNGGNVGIGTTAPLDKLDVRGRRALIHVSGNTYNIDGWGKYVVVGEIARENTWPTFLPAGSVGLEASWDSDSLFVGLRDYGWDRKDAIINWGDNTNDNLRIQFSGNDRIIITSAGNVGIGTTGPFAPATRLKVLSGIGAAVYEDWPAGWGGGIATWDIVGASAYFSNYITRSDISLKKDIQPLNYGILDKVLKLNPISFYWKDENMDKEKHFGFVAQEVEEVLPELVRQDSQGKKTLSYNELIPYLVRAIQEQQKEIEELKAQIQNSKH